MRNFVLVIVLSFFCISVNAQENTAYKVITPLEFEQAVSPNNKILIDVRTREEYDEGHIPNAGNIDFYGDDFQTKMDFISRNLPLYIYCKSGKRSAMASQMLKGMGFKSVIELENGFQAWRGKMEK